MSELIKFDKVNFSPGDIILTVRNVDWWTKARVNKELLIIDSKLQVVASAIVRAKGLLRFRHITDELLVREHDEECRTVEGLKKALEKYYGEITDDTHLCFLNLEIHEVKPDVV